MADIKSLISSRFKKDDETSSKMKKLGELSSMGNRSSFSGVFNVSELSKAETNVLENLLNSYKKDKQDLGDDLQSLSAITSEIKAIHHQAIVLHGERIKKAGDILKKYRDGAFSEWLLATYGNRQTPYNFLQYYEFYQTLPTNFKPKLDMLPKQAVYTLASRQGSLEKKMDIISEYQGETKTELLLKIRETFPLNEKDKRKKRSHESLVKTLNKVLVQVSKKNFKPSHFERQELFSIIDKIQASINR